MRVFVCTKPGVEKSKVRRKYSNQIVSGTFCLDAAIFVFAVAMLRPGFLGFMALHRSNDGKKEKKCSNICVTWYSFLAPTPAKDKNKNQENYNPVYWQFQLHCAHCEGPGRRRVGAHQIMNVYYWVQN